MRKLFVLIFSVTLLFNIFTFTDLSADYEGNVTLTAFSARPVYGKDSVGIRLSEISRAAAVSFSYNKNTGFIYADDGVYRIYIKPMDSNIEISDTDIWLNNVSTIDVSAPYSFKLYAFISKLDEAAEARQSIFIPDYYFGDKDNIAFMAEVAVEFKEKLQFVVTKLGTSSQSIDKKSIEKLVRNNMLLVNKDNSLDRSYIPSDLVYSKPSRGRSPIDARLDREAMWQLNQMLNAAYDEGVSGMVITSAYRNFDKQTSLFNNKTSLLSRKMNRKAAMEEASKVVAIPGTSEHQTGLAIDIISEGVGLTSSFDRTKQGMWLKENSWRFGYIIRYPEDKTEITGVIYEPWHIRYVGEGHSEIMKSMNMCLEEYVKYLESNRIIYFNSGTGADYVVQYLDKEEINSSGLEVSLQENSTWNISNGTKDSYVLIIKL